MSSAARGDVFGISREILARVAIRASDVSKGSSGSKVETGTLPNETYK
jgi:hypothetical protein